MANPDAGRRGFLTFCTGLLMALIGLLLAVPALAYFLAPLRWGREEDDSEGGFVKVGRLADLPVGQWRLLPLETVRQDGWKKTKVRHSVWVRRQSNDQSAPTVLSPICPHLGCPVNWHPDNQQFICPCHAGKFDATGQHLAGPPPRSMDVLACEVRSGQLWVHWQDFKIGVSERLPVSG
jgi:menaquinol-cytochrome c reductase iron-sulfur subunit